MQAAAAETVKQLGGIDILVNSAGIAGPTATVLDVTIEDWHRTIAINLNGTFFTNRAVVPHMIASNYGRIVNIASIAGKEGNPNASAYSASKAAVIGFTKSLAKELAKTNITVNSVTPAAVRTPIFDQMPQSHIDFMLSKIPRAASARSTRWQASCAGSPARNAPSPRVRCSTSRAAAPPIERNPSAASRIGSSKRSPPCPRTRNR